MFDFVRNNNRVMQVILGLVLVVFALGTGGVGYREFFSEANEGIASVDGKKITRAEFDAQHRQEIEAARRRGPNVDLKALDTPAAKRATLDAIIRDRVLQAAVAHQDLGASAERVLQVWRTNPQFQQLRAMPKEQQQAMLAQQGLTLDTLADRIQQQLASEQALKGVADSSFISDTTTKAGSDALLDQREIQWQRFDTKDYAAQIQPTDAQLQAYYADKAHANEFKAPETATVEYVVFDVATLKPQVNVSAEAIQTYYDQNKAHYTVAEERRASHILVSVDPKAAPADVVKAKARADAILAEVRKAPASFADVAKKESDDAGSKNDGGDLDFMTQKAAPSHEFADKLFSMKEGDISDVVRTPAGFHIIKMTGVRGGAVKPFDEVKPQIEDQLRTQLAQKAYASGVEKFTNLVYEQGNKLPDRIDIDPTTSFKLTKQTGTVHRKPAADAAGPLASPRLLDAIFAADSVQKKQNTEATETGSAQLTSARIVEYQPQHTLALADVHDQVVASVRRTLAAAAAKKDGEAKVEAARKDAALALPVTATVGRGAMTADVPQQVVEAALKADIAKGPAVTGIALPDGGYAALRVLKVVPRKSDDPLLQQARGSLVQALSQAEADAVYDVLKARYKVEINDSLVAKVVGTAASGSN